jgi:hypothetical protein
MAERVKAENDLVAITISLDPDTPPAALARVRLVVERATKPVHETSVPATDLGIPLMFDPSAYRYREPEWRLPASLVNELVDAVGESLGDELLDILWLHLASPSGFVPVVPWEALLTPAFRVPVVRVPNFALFPPLDTRSIDVALCISQPVAKAEFNAAELAATIARRLLVPESAFCTVHVFADAPTHSRLRNTGLARDNGDGAIVLHDPARAPGARRQSAFADEAGSDGWNPWLAWMKATLSARTVEAVHFLGHGYLATDQAALAVAESPVENRDSDAARFIEARQIASFLDAVGAWSVGFTTPPLSFSSMGIRVLADDLAHRRAGPILIHSLATDPDGRRLGAIWADLLHGVPPTEPTDVALYCHPRIFSMQHGSESSSFAGSLLSDPRIGGRNAQDQPAWVTLTRRYLEQSTARLFPNSDEPDSATQRAAAEGVREALAFVSSVVGGLPTGPGDSPVSLDRSILNIDRDPERDGEQRS